MRCARLLSQEKKQHSVCCKALCNKKGVDFCGRNGPYAALAGGWPGAEFPSEVRSRIRSRRYFYKAVPRCLGSGLHWPRSAHQSAAGNAGAGTGAVFSGHLRHSGAEKVRHAGHGADGDAVQPPYLKERGQQLRQLVCHPAAQRDRAGGHCNADRSGYAGGAEQLRFAGAEGRREKAQ